MSFPYQKIALEQGDTEKRSERIICKATGVRAAWRGRAAPLQRRDEGTQHTTEFSRL